jgi:hypothetical protein
LAYKQNSSKNKKVYRLLGSRFWRHPNLGRFSH